MELHCLRWKLHSLYDADAKRWCTCRHALCLHLRQRPPTSPRQGLSHSCVEEVAVTGVPKRVRMRTRQRGAKCAGRPAHGAVWKGRAASSIRTAVLPLVSQAAHVLALGWAGLLTSSLTSNPVTFFGYQLSLIIS